VNSLPDPTPLKSHALDDGFTDLVRDEVSGEAVFWVEGGGRRIEVVFGAQWQVGIVYAPREHDFICFEPMAAITNGINLAADGKYSDLQTLAPGRVWQGSFRVRALHFQPS
jgi:aldose 1-epimerase